MSRRKQRQQRSTLHLCMFLYLLFSFCASNSQHWNLNQLKHLFCAVFYCFNLWFVFSVVYPLYSCCILFFLVGWLNFHSVTYLKLVSIFQMVSLKSCKVSTQMCKRMTNFGISTEKNNNNRITYWKDIHLALPSVFN